MEIHAVRFAINNTPCCVWTVDPRALNTEFIRSLQPDYFSYLADVHTPELAGPRRQFASMALGAAYSQGLEMLFAILFASLQAPDCVVGWLPKYRQEDLNQLVAAIGRQPILTKVPLTAPTWEGIVDAFHRHVAHPEKDAEVPIKKQVVRLWRLLAKDFLDAVRSDQYNTIKHGFRAQLGGVRMRVGKPSSDGGQPPPEKFLDLGGSEFGSCFFTLESLGHKYQYKLRRVARNWCPETLAHRLRLITRSLMNIIAFLHMENRIGNTDNVTFGWPDAAAFEQAIGQATGIISVKFPSLKIEPGDISAVTRGEILSVYAPPTPGIPASESTTPPAAEQQGALAD